MLRLHVVTFVSAALFVLATGSTIAAEENDVDLATQVRALAREVESLRLEVAKLKTQLFKVQAQLQQVAPREPSEIWLPPIIELPPEMSPSLHDLPSWQYDRGLYVFPGLDAPALRGERQNSHDGRSK